MRLVTKLVFLAVLFAATVAERASAGNGDAPESIDISRQVHSDDALGYSLTYPQDWHIWAHHAGVILSPGADPRIASCTLLVAAQIGVPEHFALDPDEWTALMRSSVPGYELIQSKAAAFSDIPVTSYIGTYKGSDGAMKILQAEAVKGDTLYTLECSASAALFDTYQADMEDILHSLRIVGAVPDANAGAQSFFDYRDYSFRLLAAPSAQASLSGPLRFDIIDDRGELVRNFELVHERLLHLFVVRKDLTDFQHLHPQLDPANGIFSLSNFGFPSSGDYRLIAEFLPSDALSEPGGGQSSVTVHVDLKVGGGEYRPQALAPSADRVMANGYEVALRSDIDRPGPGLRMLTIAISKDGRPVTDLGDYLGALGHAVILHEGDLRYTHVHPMPLPSGRPQTGEVMFHVSFPEPGLYRGFFQFQHHGTVNTAAFVFDVPASAVTLQPTIHQHAQPTK